MPKHSKIPSMINIKTSAHRYTVAKMLKPHSKKSWKQQEKMIHHVQGNTSNFKSEILKTNGGDHRKGWHILSAES